MTWRAVPVGWAPESGLNHRVIRTAAEWIALFDGSGAPAPDIAFDRDMVVLLPAGLDVASVSRTAEALVFECGRRSPSPGTEGEGERASGRAVIVPISDLPVRVAIR